MQIFAALCAFGLSLGALAAERVHVDINSQWKQETLNIQFKIQTSKDLKLNLEAPWKLKLADPAAKAFAKATFSKADFDTKLPGYTVVSRVKKNELPASLSYELTAYVCSHDGTQCYHDVVKDEIKVPVSK